MLGFEFYKSPTNYYRFINPYNGKELSVEDLQNIRNIITQQQQNRYDNHIRTTKFLYINS
jgi:hypothetical protein